jgi:alkylation response protein AidB-like acyl-CoA dehydrogenase
MVEMTDPLIARRDLDFLLCEWLGIQTLFERPAFADHSRETVAAMLDVAQQCAMAHFLPHYKQADQREPYVDGSGVHTLPAIREALARYAELGFFSAGFAPELGGMNLPYLACAAAFAIFAAANISTVAYAMLTVANARLIATFGTSAQIDAFARPQIAGRWFGTMCLSEPQAGSSLADIRTRAQLDGADALGFRYRLTGNKMWISGGDHDAAENIVHLVLAKIPRQDHSLPRGAKGISLFIVPKLLPDGGRNDIATAGLNHKMGYRGTANCLLNFGEKEGAVGWLVGKAGDGLHQMFMMMNEARTGVGLGAAALGYRGYRHALQYARERQQGRPIGTPNGPSVAIIEHADVKRMLLAQKAYAEGALALCLYCAKLIDEHDDAEAQALIGLLTPVVKTWPSEYGIAANDLAIQVHGGYGYTRDFDVEQLYRDNRLNPIHEGTTGIQAIDLLGRKILRSDGAGLAVAQKRIDRTVAAAMSVPPLAVHARALAACWTKVRETVDALRAREGASIFDNATYFQRAFSHVIVAWLWLDQSLIAERARTLTAHDSSFYAGKLRACRFFFECELPKTDAWLSLVASGNDVASGASLDVF